MKKNYILKNNVKAIFLYFIVVMACGLLMEIYSPSFSIAMVIFGKSYIITIFASILLVGLGMLLKIQENKTTDFISVIGIGAIMSLFLFILAVDFSYIDANLHQSTPDPTFFSFFILDIIEPWSRPESWFILFAQPNKLSRFLIVLSGIYPSTMFFIGIQIKKGFIKYFHISGKSGYILL